MESIQWQSFIKSCLDILRNGDSKYDGLKAINEFITLITLKLVEHRICEIDELLDAEDDKIRIGLDCKFTNLYVNYCINLNNENKITKAKQLFDLVYNYERVWTIDDEVDDNLNHISQTRIRNNELECIIHRFNKYTKNLNKLTDNIIDVKTLTSFTRDHCRDVQKLVIKIQETFGDVDIVNFTYDAFGEAYEKMIADELGNDSKRNGQYFTKRDLIKLIITELNIKDTDKCYDPACGTGGFLLGFANEHKTNKHFIENNIYGQEYLYEVYKTLNFNMLANNYDKSLKNITKGDSIRNNHYHESIKNKFDVCGANPPFGVSIDEMPKEYPINKIKNSVCCFLQHIYFSLKDGGRAGVIIDRGILNNGTDKKNSWEIKLRKFLLEKTSITKIINLPTGIFKHTNFSTSLIFFTKGQKTKEIKYIEGYYNNDDKGKSDKQMHLGKEYLLSIEQIKLKNYSLKFDDYFKEESNKQDTSGWLKLGDVCETNGGIKFKLEQLPTEHTSDYIYLRGQNLNDIKFRNTNYVYLRYYDKKFESYKINNGDLYYILVGTVGICGISNINAYLSGNICSLFNFEKYNFNKKFVMYYLIFNKPQVSSNAQPNISRETLKNFLIPNLTLSHQEEIVKFLDEIYEHAKIEDTLKYLKDKPIFNTLINRNYDDFKNIIFYQDNIKQLLFELSNIPKKKNLQIKSIFNSYQSVCENKKLGDIVEIQFGLRITKGKNEVSKDHSNAYPVYGGGDITFYTNNYNREGETIILSRFGVSPKCVRIINGKIFLNDSAMSINIINENKTNKNYIKYYLYYFQLHIYNNYTAGQGQQNTETNKLLREFNIPVPSLEIQEKIIKQIESLEDPLTHYNQYAKMLETELNNINEIISNMTILNNNNKELDNDKVEINDVLLDNNEDNNNEENINNEDLIVEDLIEEELIEDEEIEYKGKSYFLNNNNVYIKLDNGTKGPIYGIYKNGKVKKIKITEITI